MTVQEAIDVFEKPSDHIKTIQINHVTGIVYSADLVKAFEMAIKALKKQIPKKPTDITKVRDGEGYIGLIGKCPFCGGDKVGLWYNRSVSPLIPTTCEVHCYDCHFGLAPSKTKEEAINAWNTRTPVENVLEQIELQAKSLSVRDCCFIRQDKVIEIIKQEMM